MLETNVHYPLDLSKNIFGYVGTCVILLDDIGIMRYMLLVYEVGIILYDQYDQIVIVLSGLRISQPCVIGSIKEIANDFVTLSVGRVFDAVGLELKDVFTASTLRIWAELGHVY